MKDLIIEQIRKAKDEAVSWANHEIKAIVVKYQGRKDKKQLLEAELLKAKEFQDSAVGNGYINSLAPGIATDEELIQTIANYYLTCKFLRPNPTTGWTDETTLKYVHDDSLIFLRRYFLVKYLTMLINSSQLEEDDSLPENIVIPAEHKSDFVFLFRGSDHIAKLFIN